MKPSRDQVEIVVLWVQPEVVLDLQAQEAREFFLVRARLQQARPNAPSERRPTGENARNSPKSLRCGPSAPLGG